MNIVGRALVTFVLATVIGFCVFGFFATWEYSQPSRRLPWQLGYGTIGTGAVFCIILVWRGPRVKR